VGVTEIREMSGDTRPPSARVTPTTHPGPSSAVGGP
jgi:hypothetical protein